MISGEFPAGTILVDAQSMAGREMPSEHLTAPAAFEANDIIGMDRSTDRHDGGPLSLGCGCRFFERLMDGRNQCRELIGPDLVSPNVRGDDIGGEFSIQRDRR
jgi:hypothetical protein